MPLANDHTAVEQAAPGWYPDPTTPVLVRWWDGTGWTHYTSPNPATVSPGRKRTWKFVTLVVVIVLVTLGLVAVAVIVAISAAINDWASNK